MGGSVSGTDKERFSWKIQPSCYVVLILTVPVRWKARVHAEILSGYLLEQGEKGLTGYERDQKPQSLRLSWGEEEGIGLEFDVAQGVNA